MFVPDSAFKMAVSLPLSIVLYVEKYLHNAAKLFSELLPASKDVFEGFCLPAHVLPDPSAKTNPRRFDPLDLMKLDDKTTLAMAISAMFDKWMEKLLVDVVNFVKVRSFVLVFRRPEAMHGFVPMDHSLHWDWGGGRGGGVSKGPGVPCPVSRHKAGGGLRFTICRAPNELSEELHNSNLRMLVILTKLFW